MLETLNKIRFSFWHTYRKLNYMYMHLYQKKREGKSIHISYVRLVSRTLTFIVGQHEKHKHPNFKTWPFLKSGDHFSFGDLHKWCQHSFSTLDLKICSAHMLYHISRINKRKKNHTFLNLCMHEWRSYSSSIQETPQPNNSNCSSAGNLGARWLHLCAPRELPSSLFWVLVAFSGFLAME